MELEDHASILDAQLTQQLGVNYTGEWFDPKAGKVMLGITSGGYERTVEADLNNLGLADNAEIVTEPASRADLASARTSLASALSSLQHGGLVTVGTDSSADAVVVEEASSLTTAQKNEVTTATGSLSVPHEVHESTRPTLMDSRTECSKSKGYCDAPLHGGVRIAIEGEKEEGSCSAGYITQSNHASAKYLLTAGHCVKSEFGKQWKAWDSSGTPHNIGKGRSWALGTTKELEEHHGDYGLISMEEPYWSKTFKELRPWIVTWPSSEVAVKYQKNYAITSTHSGSELTLKFVVCTSGVGEGAPREDCGEVVKNNEAINLREEPGEPAVFGVGPVIEVNYCSEGAKEGEGTRNTLRPGNSGSPTYKNHVAEGIFTAEQVEEPEGKKVFLCNGFVQPISEAERALHVHVITSESTGQ